MGENKTKKSKRCKIKKGKELEKRTCEKGKDKKWKGKGKDIMK